MTHLEQIAYLQQQLDEARQSLATCRAACASLTAELASERARNEPAAWRMAGARPKTAGFLPELLKEFRSKPLPKDHEVTLWGRVLRTDHPVVKALHASEIEVGDALRRLRDIEGEDA